MAHDDIVELMFSVGWIVPSADLHKALFQKIHRIVSERMFEALEIETSAYRKRLWTECRQQLDDERRRWLARRARPSRS